MPAEAAQRDRNVEAGVDVLGSVVILEVLVGEGAGIDGKRAAAAAFDDGALHIRIAGHIERGAAGAVDRGQVVGPGLVLGAAPIGEGDAAAVLERSTAVVNIGELAGGGIAEGAAIGEEAAGIAEHIAGVGQEIGVGRVAARTRGGRHAA